MQQKSTPTEKEEMFFAVNKKKGRKAYPEKQTLIFIKQFAHAYCWEERLPLALNVMILN